MYSRLPTSRTRATCGCLRRARRRPLASHTCSTICHATSRLRARKRSSGKAQTVRRSRACSSIRSAIRAGNAIRWRCRRTAARRPPTSTASGSGSTTRRCWPRRGTRSCNPTIGAAPGTATRFCGTWSATISRIRISTSWPAWTK